MSTDSVADSALLQAAQAAHRRGRAAHAERLYRRLLDRTPGHFFALESLGVLLGQQHRASEALVLLERALTRRTTAPLLANLSQVRLALGQVDAAEAALRRALAIDPGFPTAQYNLAVLHYKRGAFDDAQAWLDRLQARDPDHDGARFVRALIHLAEGDYARGWPLYEARYAVLQRRVRLPMPAWRGEPLDGRAILVWPEQGLGDALQFARFVPALKRRGAGWVSLVADPAVAGVLRSLPGVDWVGPATALPRRHHDLHVRSGSLPGCLGVTLANLPTAQPYLRAIDAASDSTVRIAAALGGRGGGPLRVGLVWRGNPRHVNDSYRSLPSLLTLAPLWRVPGCRFVSLQLGAGHDEARAAARGEAPFASQPLVDLGAVLRGFDDTAVALGEIDLLICVDTAIAHLAGALGRPCWVVLGAFASDWRWLRDREDSPWYPRGMRLFRQHRVGEWSRVMARLVSALRALQRDRDRAVAP